MSTVNGIIATSPVLWWFILAAFRYRSIVSWCCSLVMKDETVFRVKVSSLPGVDPALYFGLEVTQSGKIGQDSFKYFLRFLRPI